MMSKTGDKGLININVPNIPESEWKGIRVTSLGKSEYENVFEQRKDPIGRTYYWQGGKVLEHSDEGTDWEAIRSGYVSLTPMHSILTDIERIKRWNNAMDSIK